MKKLILIILIAFSFSADWWKGNNNPDGKTGLVTLDMDMKNYDAVYDGAISRQSLTFPLTDFFTIRQTRLFQANVILGNFEWDEDRVTWNEVSLNTEIAIHLPLYKLWE